MSGIKIEERKLTNPDGSSYALGLVTPGTGCGAIVVPLARRRGMVYVGLVEQWREALQERTLEIPRGSTSDLSEAEAMREVTEEIGQPPVSLRFATTLSPDTGLLTTRVGVWAAAYPFEVTELAFKNDNENQLEVKWLPVAAAQVALMRQKVVCSMSVAAFSAVEATGIMTGGVGR